MGSLSRYSFTFTIAALLAIVLILAATPGKCDRRASNRGGQGNGMRSAVTQPRNRGTRAAYSCDRYCYYPGSCSRCCNVARISRYGSCSWRRRCTCGTPDYEATL